MSRTVAIVGRPNVGKSRLFNRLARRRISIVHDQPGVTRDVISADIKDGAYTLLDTGGIGLTGKETSAQLIPAIEAQAQFAIDTSDVILFLLDAKDGVTSTDERIARHLRRSGKHVVLVANKIDFHPERGDDPDFYKLGLGEPVLVSAEHGLGEDSLRAAIAAKLGPLPLVVAEAAQPSAPLCVCFAGRPNVGKSSLSNRLIRSDRLIVNEQPGTTRDAIEVAFEFRGRDGQLYPFRLIDTAGIKSATKLASSVEYFSRVRSLDAIRRADVVFVVLDAFEGVTEQDKAIAGEVLKEAKPVVVVVNKWDLVHDAFMRPEGIPGYESEREFREKFGDALLQRLFFTPSAPVVFVSALSGHEVDRMLNAAVKLHRLLDGKLATARLNQTLTRLTERTPPPAVGGRRFRIYYAVQTGNRPFRVRLYCNQERRLTESYRRYLEAGVIAEFGLDGCPVLFDLVGKKPRTRFSSGVAREADED
jgi:GTP-binding protein